MKCLAIGVVAVTALAGCGQKMDDSRTQAHQDWTRIRAEAVCAQAAESLRIGQLELAARQAREALTLDENYDDARMVLAKTYIERNQYVSAAIELRHVLRRQMDSADALYLLAVADEKGGNLPEALAGYLSACELDEGNFHAVLAAAEVLAAMDKPGEARDYLNAHLHRADGDPAAHELAGRLAMLDDDYAAAADHYELACQVDPGNPAYIEALAIAQVFGGRTGEAIPVLLRRSEMSQKPAPKWVYTMLGDCCMAIGELDAAHDAYHRACELAPADPAAWVNAAKALLAMRRLPQAVDAAAKALSLAEDRLDASLVMGYALLLGGQAGRAVDVLERAAQLAGQDETLLYVLGKAHEAAGENREAQQCYSAAAELNPDNPLGAALLADISAGAAGPR